MGNQNSQPDDLLPPESTGILKDMQIIRLESHKLFGSGAVMKVTTKSSSLYFLREKTYMDGSTIKQKVFELQNREKHQHPNLISVKGIASRQETQMCSTVSKLYVLTEYSEMTLDSKITQQSSIPSSGSSQSRLFPQQQLIRILLDCAQGLEFAQANHFRCWDIQPSTIFIDNKGTHQIVDSAVTGLETNQWEPCHDVNKSEVYALGICLIELALNKKLMIQMEDEQEQHLRASLQLIREKYDSGLSEILESMVRFDEERRITSSDLVKKVKEISSRLIKSTTQTKPKQEFLSVVKNKGVKENTNKTNNNQYSLIQENLSAQKLIETIQVSSNEVTQSDGKIAYASENIVEEDDDEDKQNQTHQGIERCSRRCPDNSQAVAARKELNNSNRGIHNQVDISGKKDGNRNYDDFGCQIAYNRVNQGVNSRNDDRFISKNDLKMNILFQDQAENNQKEDEFDEVKFVSKSETKESHYVTVQNDSKHSTVKYNYAQPAILDKPISHDEFNEENIILQANHHRNKQNYKQKNQVQQQHYQQELNILPSDDLLNEEEQIEVSHVGSSINNQLDGIDRLLDERQDDGENDEHKSKEGYPEKNDGKPEEMSGHKDQQYQESSSSRLQQDLQQQILNIKLKSPNEINTNNVQHCVKSKSKMIDTAKICAGILTPYLKQPGESKTAHLLCNLYDRSNSNNYENLRDFKITKYQAKIEEELGQKSKSELKNFQEESRLLIKDEDSEIKLNHKLYQEDLKRKEDESPEGNKQKDNVMYVGIESNEKKNGDLVEETNKNKVSQRYPLNQMNICLQGLQYQGNNGKIDISASKDELRQDIHGESPERNIHSRRILGLQSDTHRQIYQDNSNHSSNISNSNEINHQDIQSNFFHGSQKKIEKEGEIKNQRDNVSNKEQQQQDQKCVKESQQCENDQQLLEVDKRKEQKLKDKFIQSDQENIQQSNVRGIEVKRSTQSEQNYMNNRINRSSEKQQLMNSTSSMPVSENYMKASTQNPEPKRKQQFQLILPLQDSSQAHFNQAQLSQNQMIKNNTLTKVATPQLDNLKSSNLSNTNINNTTQHPNLRLQSNQSSQNLFTPQKPPSRQQSLENVKVRPSLSPLNSSLYSDSFCNPIQGQILVQHYADGSRYEGEKQNGMRHGKGRFYYSEGGLYDGQWYANKMQGKGTLYYSSGKIAYEGDWMGDKFQGFGVLYNEHPTSLNQSINSRVLNDETISNHWVKYDGEFKNDQKHGFGTLYLSNSEKFSGTFQCDLIHGPGTYFTLQPNNEVNGIWYNNVLMHQH